MSSYLNKVSLIGNLTHVPDLRRTQGGQSVCEFSIAIIIGGGRQTETYR